MDLSKCDKVPSRGGMAIKTVNSEIARLGLGQQAKGLKKDGKCKLLAAAAPSQKIHDEVLANIMARVDMETLSKMCAANKQMKNICAQDWFWHERLKRNYNETRFPAKRDENNGGRWFWRDIYVKLFFDEMFHVDPNAQNPVLVVDVRQWSEHLNAVFVLYLKKSKFSKVDCMCGGRAIPAFDFSSCRHLRTLKFFSPARKSQIPALPSGLANIVLNLPATLRISTLNSEIRHYTKAVKLLWKHSLKTVGLNVVSGGREILVYL